MKTLNVAIIGHGFMGRAHSHAWKNVAQFFDVDIQPNLRVACGRDQAALRRFADRWGWAEIETDWRETVARPDVHIVDIVTPPLLHHDIAIQAARHGKHIFCEKPLALNARQAQEMYDAAQTAGVVHYVNHNYRRVPAIALAKQLIQEGRLGRIYHWRSAYLNSSWVDPQRPMTAALQKEKGGIGVAADLHSHTIDLARYLVGEIASVVALTRTFVTERPRLGEAGTGRVTVDDATSMLVEFENGALGSFEASRFALGRRNYNYFEIYGSRGSLSFNLERMNELEFFSLDDPEFVRGFKTILATERVHPYAAAWWHPGHIIGYEHTFYHAVFDFLNAVSTGKPIAPNFADGVQIARVLDAATRAAETGEQVVLDAG